MEDLQDFLYRDLYEDDTNTGYELESLLNFIRLNTVPLNSAQVKAIFLLNEFGLSDIAGYINAVRGHMVGRRDYLSFVDSLTLGSRIKGTARLDQVLKSTDASKMQIIKPSEMKV